MVRHFSRQHQKRGEPKICNNTRCKVCHRTFSLFTRMGLKPVDMLRRMRKTRSVTKCLRIWSEMKNNVQ